MKASKINLLSGCLLYLSFHTKWIIITLIAYIGCKFPVINGEKTQILNRFSWPVGIDKHYEIELEKKYLKSSLLIFQMDDDIRCSNIIAHRKGFNGDYFSYDIERNQTYPNRFNVILKFTTDCHGKNLTIQFSDNVENKGCKKLVKDSEIIFSERVFIKILYKIQIVVEASANNKFTSDKDAFNVGSTGSIRCQADDGSPPITKIHLTMKEPTGTFNKIKRNPTIAKTYGSVFFKFTLKKAYHMCSIVCYLEGANQSKEKILKVNHPPSEAQIYLVPKDDGQIFRGSSKRCLSKDGYPKVKGIWSVSWVSKSLQVNESFTIDFDILHINKNAVKGAYLVMKCNFEYKQPLTGKVTNVNKLYGLEITGETSLSTSTIVIGILVTIIIGMIIIMILKHRFSSKLAPLFEMADKFNDRMKQKMHVKTQTDGTERQPQK